MTRAHVALNPLSDPEPYRGVIPVDEDKGQSYSAIGVIYHPEGRPAGFNRDRVNPMDRQGR